MPCPALGSHVGNGMTSVYKQYFRMFDMRFIKLGLLETELKGKPYRIFPQSHVGQAEDATCHTIDQFCFCIVQKFMMKMGLGCQENFWTMSSVKLQGCLFTEEI
jgi:hypothetical protein